MDQLDFVSRRQGGGERNRATVEVVICAECESLDVRCKHRYPTHSQWACRGCGAWWNEPPGVGKRSARVVS